MGHNRDLPNSAELFASILEAAHQAEQSEVSKAATQIAEAIDQWNQAHRHLYPDAQELGRRGWTAPVWAATIAPQVIVRSTTPEDIDEYFLREYKARFRARERRMFRALRSRPSLSPWQPILSQTISVYRRGQYLVTAPVLLTIFEGLLAALAGQLGSTDTKRHSSTARKEVDEGMSRLLWISVEAFTLELFQNHHFAKAPPSRLNRNWVLHGRDSGSAGRADCLRLFQALDTVSFFADRGMAA